MKITVFLFGFSSLASCCSTNWSVFKTVLEGPFSILSFAPYDFYVRRSVRYRCTKEEKAEFKVSREIFSKNRKGEKLQAYTFSGLGKCKESCRIKNVTVIVESRPKFEKIGQFIYPHKNCAMLYWTSWTALTSCLSSKTVLYKRDCIDCDDERSDAKYCVGSSTKQVTEEKCDPKWSDWGGVIFSERMKGKCVRIRKCLYGDNREAEDSKMCSEDPYIMEVDCLQKIGNINSQKVPKRNSLIIVLSFIIKILFVVLLLLFMLPFAIRCCFKTYLSKLAKPRLNTYSYINPRWE